MDDKVRQQPPQDNSPLEVDFAIERETIGKYLLEDGSTVIVRTVPMRVFHKGFNEQGLPQYDIRMQNILDVEPSPQFKSGGAK